MIILQVPNTNPHIIESGIATKIKGNSLPTIVNNTIDFCHCEVECTYEGRVFAEVGGEDYKNDNSQFLFRRLINSDTVIIKLYKDGVELSTLNNNVYGTYFDGFVNGSPEQQLYVGYLLSWENVYNLHGGGQYQVKANLSIVGQITVFESELFNLMGYSDLAADRTVKIETVQNGNIINSLFDFTGLNWNQSIRVDGIFYEDSESFEKNAYLTQDYRQSQIQDKILENWVLSCNFVPRSVSEFLIKNAVLSNEFKVTDYNLLNEEVLRSVSVYPESIEKTRLIDIRRSNYIIKFTSKNQNIIKRNY